MFIQSPLMQFGIRKLVQLRFPKALTSQSSDFPYWLTFDDGPHPESTPYLLDLLDELNQKACFFVIGQNVERYPHQFEQILAAGHAVGNHTYSHLSASDSTPQEYAIDIQKCQSLYPFSYFRPPYGKLTAQHYLAIPKELETIYWTKLLWDWSSHYSESRWEQIIQSSRPNSDILVMHDSDKAFPQVQKIAKFLRAKGF